MNSVKCNVPKFNFSSYFRQVANMSVQSMSDLLSFEVINIHNKSHQQSYQYVYCLNANTQHTWPKHSHACTWLCMTCPMHQMKGSKGSAKQFSKYLPFSLLLHSHITLLMKVASLVYQPHHFLKSTQCYIMIRMHPDCADLLAHL